MADRMAEQKLNGKKIAILATDGVEQVELTDRARRSRRQARPTWSRIETGQIQGFDHLDHADKLDVDKAAGDQGRRLRGVVIPGGVAIGDFLRADETACTFVAAFAEQSKPIASICHGPWILVETGIVKGRTITSWPSLKTESRTRAAPGSTRRSTPTAA